MKLESLQRGKVWEAAVAYINLHSNGVYPLGHFDKGGRFYLAEQFDCCKAIRLPSRAFPLSMLHHGRSINHVATAYGISPLLLRRAAVSIKSGRPIVTKGLSEDDLVQLMADALTLA